MVMILGVHHTDTGIQRSIVSVDFCVEFQGFYGFPIASKTGFRRYLSSKY
uniref:Uncharacterized protein n=1 Tax=Rhizophagus irregularis (strain DAOM 181602 / DAOM 197198 / MUCL 43194) TaxID=747089 RepID=U9UY60_RHIID